MSSGKAQDLHTGYGWKRMRTLIKAQWLSRDADGRGLVVEATKDAVHEQGNRGQYTHFPSFHLLPSEKDTVPTFCETKQVHGVSILLSIDI